MIAQHAPTSLLADKQMDSAVASSIASPPPALNDTSDCGSSSGVGGMKDASPAASDAASSSSEQTPGVTAIAEVPSSSACYDKRPSISLSRFSIPPPALPLYGGPMMVPPPPATNNDLFVHIQSGETLSIIVGPDIQTITGPATVRMVGEAGAQAPTVPLPLHVPKGHVVYQVCDDQGFLRHIILSPETSRDASSNVSPGANPSTSTAPTLRPSPSTMPMPQQPFYTVNRQYQRGMASRRGVPEPLLVPTPLFAQEPAELDPEEQERIQKMLNSILPPSISKQHPTEVEVTWQEMDTTEAACAAPFPQVEVSEFTYQLCVQEVGKNARRANDIILRIANHRAGSSRSVALSARVTRLRPARDYSVMIQAKLEERGLVGEYSAPTYFRTPPMQPDAPSGLKAEAVAHDSVTVRWNAPAEHAVTQYTLYRQSEHDADESVALETSQMWAKIDGLKPATNYKFKVTASSKFGESSASNVLSIMTPGGGEFARPAVLLPTVTPCGARSAKITWPAAYNCTYTVEQVDASGVTTMLKNRASGAFQFANELNANADYLFRVIAHTPDDNFIPSEFIPYRHIPSRNAGGRQDGLPQALILATPSKPYVSKADARKVELNWRGARDVFYVLEGATATAASGRYEWRQIYRGNSLSLQLGDEHAGMIFFRLQHHSKRSAITSEWSEVLRIAAPVKPLVYRIPPLLAPVFSDIGKHAMRISWHPAEFSPMVAGTTVLYEVRRIDSVSQLLYSGPEPSYLMESLRPKQHVSVQARIVAVDGSGKRREGEWSLIGSACTLRDAPHPPHSLALSHDRKELHWAVSEDLLGDASFTVTRTTVGEEATGSEWQHETSVPRLSLSELAPGVTYAFQVMARCPWGDSPPSETFHMSTAAEVPCAPETITVDGKQQRELTVRWSPPDARGSALRAFHIKIERAGEIVRDAMLAAAASSSTAADDLLEFRVEDLEFDTLYRVYVAASNDVGTGPHAKADCRTRRRPPPPPSLDAEIEPNQIKLKWRAPLGAEDYATIGYRIARLADATSAHLPCYEGYHCSTKIKGLQENTTYRFQIRSFDRPDETGAGPWSDVFAFRTPLVPPPTVRVVPTAVSNGNGSHTLDWPQVIPKGNPRGLFYRVQTHAATDKKDQWTTVYEGGQNSYVLRVPAESSIVARVFVVRPDGGTGIVSPPSPPLNVSSIGETKPEQKVAPVEVPPSVMDRLFASIRQGGIGLFVVMIILVAACFGFIWLIGLAAPEALLSPPRAPKAP